MYQTIIKKWYKKNLRFYGYKRIGIAVGIGSMF